MNQRPLFLAGVLRIWIGGNRTVRNSIVMSKKSKSSKSLKTGTVAEDAEQNNAAAISFDKKGNIVLRIVSKPGAKTNNITGIDEEGIGVQINAPPVDGQANTELIKYLSGVLDVRKSDLSLDRGSRSRQKKLILSSAQYTSIDEVKKKLLNVSTSSKA